MNVQGMTHVTFLLTTPEGGRDRTLLGSQGTQSLPVIHSGIQPKITQSSFWEQSNRATAVFFEKKNVDRKAVHKLFRCRFWK